MTSQSILVVDDEPDIRNLVKEILEDEGYRVDVAENASSAREARRHESPDLVLLDIWMPDEDGISLLKEWKERDQLHCPVIMMSGHGTVETAVEATRLGAYDFVEKPLSLAKLLLTVEQALSVGRAEAEVDHEPQQIIGTSPAMVALREQAERLAGHHTPIFISGEPGSGRHALARYVHDSDQRKGGPFVELGTLADVAATTGEIPQTELDALAARFHAAPRSGTLYINELDELGSAMQKQILHLLKANQASFNDVRIIASTRDDPEVSLANGALREDLYYSLNVVHFHVPPLREHHEDVPALLEHFVDYFVRHEQLAYRHFNVAAQNRLRNYDWPGNVSELRNLVQRVMVLGQGVDIQVDEVDEAISHGTATSTLPASVMALPLDQPLRQARKAFERLYLERQLDAVGGNISELAKRAGVERTHLYRKLRSLGISPSKARAPANQGSNDPKR